MDSGWHHAGELIVPEVLLSLADLNAFIVSSVWDLLEARFVLDGLRFEFFLTGQLSHGKFPMS